jgi:hypothetical protein
VAVGVTTAEARFCAVQVASHLEGAPHVDAAIPGCTSDGSWVQAVKLER